MIASSSQRFEGIVLLNKLNTKINTCTDAFYGITNRRDWLPRKDSLCLSLRVDWGWPGSEICGLLCPAISRMALGPSSLTSGHLHLRGKTAGSYDISLHCLFCSHVATGQLEEDPLPSSNSAVPFRTLEGISSCFKACTPSELPRDVCFLSETGHSQPCAPLNRSDEETVCGGSTQLAQVAAHPLLWNIVFSSLFMWSQEKGGPLFQSLNQNPIK